MPNPWVVAFGVGTAVALLATIATVRGRSWGAVILSVFAALVVGVGVAYDDIKHPVIIASAVGFIVLVAAAITFSWAGRDRAAPGRVTTMRYLGGLVGAGVTALGALLTAYAVAPPFIFI